MEIPDSIRNSIVCYGVDVLLVDASVGINFVFVICFFLFTTEKYRKDFSEEGNLPRFWNSGLCIALLSLSLLSVDLSNTIIKGSPVRLIKSLHLSQKLILPGSVLNQSKLSKTNFQKLL